MRVAAPYVLFASLRAREDGEVDPHVESYVRLVEAIRDDRYDFDAAETRKIVTYRDLPLLQEA